MTIEKTLETYKEVKDKSNQYKNSFIRHILLMSSSLLGILVTLHDTNSIDMFARVSFSTTLTLLSLGILLLSISLYGQVSSYNNLTLDYWEETRKHLSDKNYVPNIVSSYTKKIYMTLEKIGYISLLSSVISLTVYGILNT